jgi:phospholipid/cholesterol/gamma-HCH transport system substrate-binding protein
LNLKIDVLKITREVKIGTFVIVGITILLMGYNFLQGFHPLRVYTEYHAVYSNVSGIVKSSQVTINGMKVGQVEEIRMLNAGDPSKILVTFSMVGEVKVPKGSEATIISLDLLGTKVIDIALSNNQEILQKGDTLIGKIEESLTTTISDMVSPLKERSEQALVALDKVLNSMNEVFDSTGTRRLAGSILDVSKSIQNLRSITERIDKLTMDESEKIQTMFSNIESITRNLRNNNEAISKSIKNISKISDTLAAAELAQTIHHTKIVMQEFAIALQKINKGDGTLGKLATDDSLYNNLNSTNIELTALLKDMQEYPGRYFSVSVFGGGKRADKTDKKRKADKNIK